MPFENEHACRLESPDDFARFRRENNFEGTGYDVVWGIKSDGSVEMQSIRYPKENFSVEEAKASCDSKGGSFEPAIDSGATTASMGQGEHQAWTTAFINDLPDASFAVIQAGGTKDDDGKTVPRTLRKLPHHGTTVKTGAEHTTVDLPHLRNALARLPQTDMSSADKAKAEKHLMRHSEALLGQQSSHSDSVYITDKNFNAKVKMLGDRLIVSGARIFKADTPMKHGVHYSPEELAEAVDGSLLFDLDHNFLAVGPGDMLIRAYMDENNEFLLGDMQFESPTLQKLVETGALNGVSVVTQWESTTEINGKEYAVGVSIPAISLTEIPFCGQDGEVEGCGITHTCDRTQIPQCITHNKERSGSCSTHCLCGGAGKENKKGGEKVSEKELEDKISELTKEIESLKGEQGDMKIDLSSTEVQEHVDKKVEEAIGKIDLTEKLEHTLGDENSADHAKVKEVIDHAKEEAIEEYKAEQTKAAVEAKQKELAEKLGDNAEDAKKVVEGLHSIEDLEAFEKAMSTGEHRLNAEGDTDIAKLAKITADFNKARGKPIEVKKV